MLRLRISLAAALFALLALVGGLGTASADSSPLTVSYAEQVLDAGVQYINVGGTGRCESVGSVIIVVELTDLDTSANATTSSETECVSVGEHVNWLVTVISHDVRRFRPGDRVLAQAEAIGAIEGSDARVLTLRKAR